MNEINLIDRDNTANILEARSNIHIGTPFQIAFAAAARMVRLLPAVDAAPVRHGRWVPFENKGHWKFIECSECNTMYHTCWKAHYHFCPNCGAKMDLEE